MNKLKKSKLVPEIRFSEFRDKEEWSEREFGELTYSVSERNKDGKKYPIYSISNAVGFLPQSDQFEGVDSHSRGYDITLYKLIGKYTFAYNPARINVGSIGYSGELFDILISSLYVCFKTEKELHDSFLLHYLRTNAFVESVKRNVEGGIRSYLFYENFAKIRIQFPTLKEQQKIADCLSSLDELIAAENQKLEALQFHKKGLMQQLFPAEGVRVPRLRFKEFRDSGEWVEDTLGKISESFSGGTPPTTHKQYYGGNIPFIRSGEIDKEVTEVFLSKEGILNSSAKLVTKGDILIALYGANSGEVSISKINGAINQAILCIRTNDSNEFIYHFLTLKKDNIISKYLQGGQGNLSGEIIKSIAVPFPKPSEQQKVAFCLSYVNEILANQNSTIENLKLHKKGLLQQLFPLK